jgi:hypothetical protein
VNDLLETFGFLANAMLDDPLMALANAVVWLDPLWDSDDANFAEHGDMIGVAMEATRIGFPETYIEVVGEYRAGADEEDIEAIVCRALDKRDIYVNDLDEVAYGIVLPSFGLTLYDPDTFTSHPDLLPIAKLFGISIEQYECKLADGAESIGWAIANSLDHHADPQWKKVGLFLQWMFGISGNSSVDWSLEDMGEAAPLGWDEVEFALDIIDEANAILNDAKEGLRLLETNPEMMRVFTKNLKRAQKAYKKGKHDDNRNQRFRIKLEWPSSGTGHAGTTLPDAELLYIRGDAA